LIVAGKYQDKKTPPFVPGNEAAGTVSAVGSGVTRTKPGDRVIVMPRGGAFAEKCVVDESAVTPLPDGLSIEQGAGFGVVYGTSYHALKQSAALKAGETLLVLGAAGGVGLAAVAIGKAIGARVIAAVGSDDKAAICREQGAQAVINYETQDLRAEVKQLTGGKGVDVVFDPVGGRFAEPALRSIAWRGRYLVIGFAAGDIPALPWNLPLLKGASIVGVFWGEFASREPAANLRGLQELIGWVGSGKIRPVISHTYTLDEAAQALRDLGARKVTGKVVIMP
jgi:NADPH2:quinone reductase